MSKGSGLRPEKIRGSYMRNYEAVFGDGKQQRRAAMSEKHCQQCTAHEARAWGLSEILKDIQELVDEQANDPGLWGVPPVGQQSIVEAYIQKELRRLHAFIESFPNEMIGLRDRGSQ